MFKTITCEECSTLFERLSSEVARSKREGRKSFCSRKCLGKNRKDYFLSSRKENTICAFCHKSFYLAKKSKSKSGLRFCCRNHKDLAQRIGGIKEIMPPHYGLGNGIHTYRKIAFENFPPKCNRCDYNKHIEILQVHHKDRDRENNTLSNLEILCPTCHFEDHLIAKDGWFK